MAFAVSTRYEVGAQTRRPLEVMLVGHVSDATMGRKSSRADVSGYGTSYVSAVDEVNDS
jgi:hypothetical protein